MNITLIEGGVWNPPRQVDCLADNTSTGKAELILGVNPTDKAVAQACGKSSLAAYVIPWLKALKLLLCVPRGMKVQELRASPGSAAVYPAFWDFAPTRLGGLLLQVLDGRELKTPYAYTSLHYHRQTTERFYGVYGTPEIRTGSSAQWRPVGWRDEVPPNVRHQLRVPAGKLAITLIRMDGPHRLLNADGGINLEDHHYALER
jgi:hypothetical protein